MVKLEQKLYLEMVKAMHSQTATEFECHVRTYNRYDRRFYKIHGFRFNPAIPYSHPSEISPQRFVHD